MKGITVLSGIFLIAAGIWCYANPGATFITIAFVLGGTMLFAGISSMIAYALDYKRRQGNVTQWRLAEGFIAAILGAVVISNQLVTDAMVPIFFGMWMLFSGTLRVLASFTLKRAGIETWRWGLNGGIVSLIAGLCGFIHPLVTAFALPLIVGSFFMIQGVNLITAGYHMQGKLHKRSRKEKKNTTTEENTK